ncbi:MAG: tryptophan-rich sensory protein [Micropruina sp.]|uniref:tryptophan-rich sensory protein n=1 Tax=Micropruina sp. TaxID=2737536 RepID=UPI0039E6DF2B
MKILVTGASGYIGARLVPRLLAAGHDVRVLSRDPSRLPPEWAERVEVCQGDADSDDALAAALDGVDVAYYLLHSMDGHGDFVSRDRELATRFAARAEEARVGRIVYLSGLHPEGELSQHLASRVEVGEILLGGAVPAAVLQAGVVLGAGSASFDMLRHLTERLPAMVAPKWLENQIQPIAVDDVLHYLQRAAELPADVNRTFDLGGPEVFSYRTTMQRYAALAGLRPRLVVTVPVLTPALASHWVGLVTPVASGIARPLVGSLLHDAVRHEFDAEQILGEPPGGPTGFDEAVRRALADYDPQLWSRTLATVAAAVAATAVTGGLLTDPGSRWYRRLRKPSFQPPAAAFAPVWSTLYALITVAATATIADARETGRDEEAEEFQRALAANLALNASWSGVFFRGHAPVAATAVAGLLALSSADLARRAAPHGPGKAVALGVYAAWCGFATVLSAAVAARNRRH